VRRQKRGQNVSAAPSSSSPAIASKPTIMSAKSAIGARAAINHATPPSSAVQPKRQTGTLRSSKTTRGLAGKKMPRRCETTKARAKSQCCTFNFTFKLNQDTDCWVLNGGTGSCQYQLHPKAILGLLPTLRATPQEIKDQALQFSEATTHTPSNCTDNYPFSDRVGTYLFSAELPEKEARQQ
jgi:hypothetical protein